MQVRISGVMVLVLGLAIVGYGFYSQRSGEATYGAWRAARARVVAVEQETTQSGHHYYPVVEFETARRKAVRARVILAERYASHASPLDVLYDPRDPERVGLRATVLGQRRESGRNAIIGGGVFALIGLISSVRRRPPAGRGPRAD